MITAGGEPAPRQDMRQNLKIFPTSPEQKNGRGIAQDHPNKTTLAHNLHFSLRVRVDCIQVIHRGAFDA